MSVCTAVEWQWDAFRSSCDSRMMACSGSLTQPGANTQMPKKAHLVQRLCDHITDDAVVAG